MEENVDKIGLGDIAKDTISGFEGVVIGVTDWMYGCRRMTLQMQALHEGKPIEPQSFDEPQLRLVKSAQPPRTAPTTGGPRATPARQATPRR